MMSAQIEFHQKRGDLGKMEVRGGGILDAGSELGWRNQDEEDQRCLCLQLTDEKFWSKKSLFALN